MLRVLLAVLLFLSCSGCGTPVTQRHISIDAITGAELLRLAAVAVVTALVGYWVARRHARPASPEPACGRGLFLVVVVSVTATALLGCVLFLSNAFGVLERRVLGSVAIVGWAAYLRLRFLTTLRERPSLEIARVGAILAVIQVPLVLALVWLDVEGLWLTRLATTAGIFAIVAMHMTWLLQTSRRDPRARLAIVTIWIDVALLLATIGSLWNVFDAGETRSRILSVLFVLTLAGTILVEVCNRFDQISAVDATRLPRGQGAAEDANASSESGPAHD